MIYIFSSFNAIILKLLAGLVPLPLSRSYYTNIMARFPVRHIRCLPAKMQS